MYEMDGLEWYPECRIVMEIRKARQAYELILALEQRRLTINR